ncbi:hypothetical protein L3i20_v237080 [Paenibacillus sp. L3-i20]|nr:hypothetical protein L3i20_v237080 [Paenibacillus sp. L3-i20]
MRIYQNNPRGYKIGQHVTVTEVILESNETPPPQPWEGRVIKISSRLLNCRPAKVYHVETSNGAIIKSWYRHIYK